MAHWAAPGVKCVCVRDDYFLFEDHGYRGGHPAVGTVCTVSWTVRRGEKVFLVLAEYGALAAFNAIGFRPVVSKTEQEDIALFAPLLDAKRHGVDA